MKYQGRSEDEDIALRSLATSYYPKQKIVRAYDCDAQRKIDTLKMLRKAPSRCTIWHLLCNALFLLNEKLWCPPNSSDKSTTTKSPKLLDQVCDKLRVKHYSIRTKQAYTGWIRRYIFFHGKRHPKEMGAAEIEAFLTRLAVERNVSASTQNLAKSSLQFLYPAILRRFPGVPLLFSSQK